MKKFDLTGAKLISLLVILPLFLWFTTLNRTVLQYKELHELKIEHNQTSQPTFPHQYITRLCFLVPGHP